MHLLDEGKRKALQITETALNIYYWQEASSRGGEDGRSRIQHDWSRQEEEDRGGSSSDHTCFLIRDSEAQQQAEVTVIECLVLKLTL